MNGLENELLAGVRVLELTRGPSGGYAGRLLANSGARVTKIVSAAEESTPFRDREKKVIQTMTRSEAGKVVTRLLGQSWDMILWDSHLEQELDQLVTDALLISRVGIRLDFPAEVDVEEEHALQALGGWMTLTGDAQKKPLQVGGHPAAYLVGAHAATAGMMALLENRWTEKGRLVQINSLAIVVSALEGAYSKQLATGQTRSRQGNRHHELTPMSILPSADGWTFVGAPVDEKWELLEGWSEIPSRPEWQQNTGRQADCETLEEELAKWTRGMTREELFVTGQLFRLPFAKVQTLEEVRDCSQLAARQFWGHSNASTTSVQIPWKVHAGPAFSKEQSTSGNAPSWKGLRVLDVTSMWSGPYCTRLFADLGAEVIKVEAPHRPDGIRSDQCASSPFFKELNRNKLGIQLDLRLQTDRQTFLELVATSDVLVENFSPRVMSNFGLGCEELWKHRPDLTIVSLSAFGQTGPYRDFVGYGPTLESMSGVASLTQYSDGQPRLPGFSLSDIGAGIHGAFALVAALFQHHRQGIGLRVDLSQYETACQFIGDYLTEEVPASTVAQPVQVRDLVDLAHDARLATIRLEDGSQLLGMPWDSKGWHTSFYPPPELGQHTDYVKKLIEKEATFI
ncbi:CoA transferase [Sporosarcina sp. FSL K6-1522]|uniref:CoA transferase n=1 Tax=Sporosarcina sp. FSL K6-1522 TaxID=2921554 RepID=UPI00315B3451